MVTLSEDTTPIQASNNGRKNEADYKIIKLLEYYSTSRDPSFSVEFRPSLKKQANGEWSSSPNRVWPEDHWTGIRRIELDGRAIHALHENPDVSRAKKPPDLYYVTIQSTFFIGMDVLKKKPVVTDRNPNLEGLVDIHRCIYLPSAHEKNQTLPEYLTQKVTFLELPDAPLHTPGIAPGLFFITPKLTGCNIFVAHDEGLHKYWVIRISGKNPHKPPALSQAKSVEARKKQGDRMDKDYPNAKLEEDQSVLVAPKYSGSGGSSSSIIPMNRFDSEELQKYERKRKVLESKSILADLDLDLKGEVPMSKYGKKSGYKKVTEADLWTPPPHYVFEAQKREMEKTMSKPKSWSQNFREFKAYAETVLDFLRRRGFNANFVCRVATDRDWQMDVRDQSFWVNDLDKQHQSKHYLYRGEAIFYGVFKEGTWKFGLKDLGLASHGRVSKMNTFPLAVLGGDFRLIHQFSERNGDDDLEDPESASNNCGNHRSRRKSIPSAAESRVLNDFRKASMHDIIDEEFD